MESHSLNTEVLHATNNLKLLLAAVTEAAPPGTHTALLSIPTRLFTLFAPADV